MSLVGQICLWLLATVVFDWVLAGRFAAFAPTVDYHYWPPSKLRVITLVMLSAALGLDVFYEYRSDLMVLVSLLAILVYGGAIMADIEAQRNRTADDRSPDLPRYSEPDADY